MNKIASNPTLISRNITKNVSINNRSNKTILTNALVEVDSEWIGDCSWRATAAEVNCKIKICSDSNSKI